MHDVHCETCIHGIGTFQFVRVLAVYRDLPAHLPPLPHTCCLYLLHAATPPRFAACCHSSSPPPSPSLLLPHIIARLAFKMCILEGKFAFHARAAAGGMRACLRLLQRWHLAFPAAPHRWRGAPAGAFARAPRALPHAFFVVVCPRIYSSIVTLQLYICLVACLFALDLLLLPLHIFGWPSHTACARSPSCVCATPFCPPVGLVAFSLYMPAYHAVAHAVFRQGRTGGWDRMGRVSGVNSHSAGGVYFPAKFYSSCNLVPFPCQATPNRRRAWRL